MEVFTINKNDVRGAEKTVKKAIFAIKKNNFGDKVAFRIIFFVVGVVYLFLTYGALCSGTTPENQDFLEKTEFLKNLWVKIITDTGLEREGDYVYVFFGGFFLTLFAAVILFPFIRKIFKVFYKEKNIKKDEPLYRERWENLVELRYKLGNSFTEYNIIDDGISAVCIYFFSSVIFTSVYCFNCFSFGKAFFSALIASVIGAICYGIEVALFILADTLFYDSNEKLTYLKYDFDNVWIELAKKDLANNPLYIIELLLYVPLPISDINYKAEKSDEDYEKAIITVLSEKINELASKKTLSEALVVLIINLYKEKKALEEQNAEVYKELLMRRVSNLFKEKIDMVFYKLYDSLKEKTGYKEILKQRSKEFLELKNKEIENGFVIDEEEYNNVLRTYKNLL